jgi:hypothetical protein
MRQSRRELGEVSGAGFARVGARRERKRKGGGVYMADIDQAASRGERNEEEERGGWTSDVPPPSIIASGAVRRRPFREACESLPRRTFGQTHEDGRVSDEEGRLAVGVE